MLRHTSLFRQLYEQYRCLMMHIAYNILGNQALAEEAVQDALLKILIHIDDIKDAACHETKCWVVLITKRTALNKLKYEKIRQHAGAEALDEAEDHEEPLENIVIRNLKIREVLSGLKAIDGKYSELMILRYYYGYTDSKLARHFGVSAEVVRKRCERGKKLLLSSLMGSKGEP